MPPTWNIDDVEMMFPFQASKFPWRNIHFQVNSRKYSYFTRYMSLFLILSNDVFAQTHSKIRPKINLYALSTLYETGIDN